MFATIRLPNFYLQAAVRHQPELNGKAVAVIDGDAAKAVLLEINEHAERAGVCAGMAPSQALARCLELIVKARARNQEQCLTDILLEHAFTLAPYVEATGPGLCTVQFTDARDIEQKVSRVVQRLHGLEIIGRAGIAENPDTSLFASHVAKPVLQVNAARDFLAPLPIETLALS